MSDEIILCPICHKQLIGKKCTCNYESPPRTNPYWDLDNPPKKTLIGTKNRTVTKEGSEQAKNLAELARKIVLRKGLF